MQMFKSYQSPLGYTNGKNNIDSYGVDHSQFSTQDELAYQFARRNRENQLIQNYNAQGISNNYPQSGTDFWGNPENNYGFGTSNIKNSAEKIEQTPIPLKQNIWNKNQFQTPTPWAQQNSVSENLNQTQKPTYAAPNPKRYSTKEIFWDGIKGFGKGTLGGIEHGLNSATYGFYDSINDAINNGEYERRQKELEDIAKQAGLGKAHKYLNYLIDYTASGLFPSKGVKILHIK